jgi:hypothetical protein
LTELPRNPSNAALFEGKRLAGFHRENKDNKDNTALQGQHCIARTTRENK